MTNQLSPQTHHRLLRYQRAEITGSILYARIAKREANAENRCTLQSIAADEKRHYETLKQYTGQAVRPSRWQVLWYTLMAVLLGYTFTIRLMERNERLGANDYRSIVTELPEIRGIIADEERHEEELLQMLDEERLQYVGDMILGLNDALVELTGTLAGLTFSLMNTHLVALSGIITGVSATLSMAASNYLAKRADGASNALKSSVYTGVAYIVTVVLMVLPYLLFPAHLYAWAFAAMIIVVVAVIAAFNYYISVAKNVSFRSRFGEMVTISLGVALIAFVIGLAAKALLGIDVG